jgi:endoglucanase
VTFAGVNIAGFDFGCDIMGTCQLNNTFDVAAKGNGIQQMDHFIKNTGLNGFRLPVGWQFLVNQLGGPLNATSFAAYDKLVQGCLSSGSKFCIVDLHNYARFNGEIVGQSGGPNNSVLVSVWSQLAQKYANESRIVFGVMNEPHDIPSIETWAQTVQEVVTAIRKVAKTQMILMPGNNFTSAAAFIDNGSAGTNGCLIQLLLI